jgi:hypothetical protein
MGPSVKKKRFRIVLRVLTCCVVLGIAFVSVGIACFPGDVAEFKEQLRSHCPELFADIKRSIIENDRDVASVGEMRQLPEFRLILSRKDVAHFFDLHEKLEDPEYGVAYYASKNIWREAVLEHEGKKYEIDIKSHGRAPSAHRNGRYISYAVKLPKGDQIRKARRFSLIVRDHMKSEKQVTYDLAEQFGVIANREELVRVQVNNWDEKIYYFDQRLDDARMEAENRSSLRLFSYSVSMLEARVKSSICASGDFGLEGFSEQFFKTLQELEYPESQHLPLHERYRDFNRAILEKNHRGAERFFDPEYIASFEAVRTIAGLAGHFALPGNLYVFLDTANGKFYPAYTRDCNQTKLHATDGQAVEQQINDYLGGRLPMLELLSRNDCIRQGKYRKIHQFIVEQQETIDERHRSILESYEKLSYYGWAILTLRQLGLYDDGIVGHNMRVLKAYLDESKPELVVSTSGNTLLIELQPNSMAALRFEELGLADRIPACEQVRLNMLTIVDGKATDALERTVSVPTTDRGVNLADLVSGITFSTAVGEESQRVPRKYALLFTFQESGPLDLAHDSIVARLTNTISERHVDGKRIAAKQKATEILKMIGTTPTRRPDDQYADWRMRNSHLDVTRTDSEELILHAGTYEIHDDLHVPENLKLVLEAGVELLLGPDTVVVGYKGLDVLGTAEAPVVVRALDPTKPFGSIGILGDKKTPCTIRHFHVSGGNERWVDGAYFSGSLSLHYTGDVLMSHCRITNGHADDGLNIKYGRAVLEHCILSNNAADQVDLDACTAVVRSCHFSVDKSDDSQAATTDINGDGLDVSGSHVFMVDCTFQGLSDKGASIGEDSRVLLCGNTFSGNRLGVAVKDLSRAYLVDNSFSRNVQDIHAYQKKNIFGGGFVYLQPHQNRHDRVNCLLQNNSVASYFPDSISPTKLNEAARDATADVVDVLDGLQDIGWKPADATAFRVGRSDGPEPGSRLQ